MGSSYNPTPQQSDPYIDSLANADNDSVKQLAGSVYRDAPGAALVTTTDAQRKNQSKLQFAMRAGLDAANRFTGGVAEDAIRGTVRGVNELGRSVAGGMAKLSEWTQATSAAKPGQNAGMLAQYRAIQRDGLVSTRVAEAAMGPDTRDSGIHNFIQGAVQFGVANRAFGFIGTGEAAGAEAAAGVAKSGGIKAALHMVRGAAADAFGFDPKGERLSNMLENAPLGIGEVAKVLASRPDDNEATARFRAALEGIVLNSTIDAAVHGIKSAAGAGIEKFRGKAPEPVNVADMPESGEVRQPTLQPVESREAPAPAAEPHEPFTIEETDTGKHRVVPADPESAQLAKQHDVAPEYDTPQQAESIAASLNYASKNAQRPKLDVTPDQATYLKSLANWIHRTGKYWEFQHGTLDVDTGARMGGAHDVNFAYDLEPEQVGHMISAMSTVFRSEMEAARVPQTLMRDPAGGAVISHAETVAKAAQDYNGTTPAAATSKFNAIADAVDEAPSAIVAAKVLRQNIAQSAEQLARQMDANPDNLVAHHQFVKAANTLLHTFVAEKRLLSGSGRALNAGQIKVGVHGAVVDAEQLGRAIRDRNVNPLDVLHFELIDENPAAHEIPELDPATPGMKGDHTPEEVAAAAPVVAGEDGSIPAKSKNKLAAEQKASKTVVGTNTWTVADEATSRIDKAVQQIDEAKLRDVGEKQDAKALKQLPAHDPARVKGVLESMGVSDEDITLARERLLAIKQTIAEKQKASGVNDVNWSRYTDVELDDLASLHGERIKNLADEQRANPMQPRNERTQYLTTRQARALARQMTYVPRNPQEQEQVLRSVLGTARKATEDAADSPPSTWDKVVSYRAWSMLSAPTTPEVNFFSAVSTALYRPVEGLLGGMLRGDTQAARQYGDLFVGQLKAMYDAMSMAKLSWDSGSSVLSARDGALPNVGAEEGPIPTVLRWLRTPERLMTAGDEFAQQMAYRGHVYSQSLSASRSAGVTNAAEIAGRLSDDIERAFTEDNRGTNPAGVSYAQDVTLRRPLEYGIGKLLEDGARDNPAIRLLFPFVKIPVNLARFTMDRAPGVGAFTRRNMTDFAAGGSQRDEAIGRQAMGTMVWSMAALAAHSGIITGGGPKDPELRRQWMNVYQPYSVKIGDQWVSYRRFEPLSTPLGIVSDFVQMMGEIDSGDDATKAIDGFAAGVASNMMSKSYLKTLSDFFYAVGSGKASAMDALVDGVAGSFVPNVVQKANPDDALRQTRDFIDRLQTRIPGLSGGLEPRRNIYGEKVMKPGSQFQRAFNPFTVRDAKADDVDVELLRLGAGMSMPVPRKYGLDLQDRSLGINNQSPYDRWMELMSQPIADGQPALRDALRSFIKSDAYKSLTDGTEGYKGSRLLAVEKIVRGYRQAAFAKMVQENPKVITAIQQEAMKKGAALSDDPDVVEALTGNSSDRQLSGHAREASMLLGQ